MTLTQEEFFKGVEVVLKSGNISVINKMLDGFLASDLTPETRDYVQILKQWYNNPAFRELVEGRIDLHVNINGHDMGKIELPTEPIS